MTNANSFETENLLLRHFTSNDVDPIYELRSDAEFMQHLTPIESREGVVSWIEYFSSYWKFNAGFWAVVLKETNETIGWSGSWSQLEFEIGKMEIGYAIAKKYAGKGFATEAARVALDYTFKVRSAERVFALATPGNTASHRIMEKLGMQVEGQQFFTSYNMEMIYYAISREEFEKSLTCASI